MYEYAADGIDALENIDPSKQLSHSPFYQLFQVIDVGGYSTCGNKNRSKLNNFHITCYIIYTRKIARKGIQRMRLTKLLISNELKTIGRKSSECVSGNYSL